MHEFNFVIRLVLSFTQFYNPRLTYACISDEGRFIYLGVAYLQLVQFVTGMLLCISYLSIFLN